MRLSSHRFRLKGGKVKFEFGMDVREEFEADLRELREASEADRKTVYRRLAKKYHPDQHKGEEELYTQLFTELENARSGKSARGETDEQGNEGDFDDDAWARGGEEAEEVAPGHEEDEVCVCVLFTL